MNLPELERDLIGAALFGDATKAIEASRLVSDEDFSSPITRRVWQAIRDSMEAGGGVADLGAVYQEVRAELNGHSPPLSWYGELEHATPSKADPCVHARILARDACDRRERAIAERGAGDAGGVLAAAEQIAAERKRREAIDEPVKVVVDDMADIFAAEPPPEPEVMVDGLMVRPGVVIVYGASGSGKSYALMAAASDLVLGGGCFCGVETLQIRPRVTKFGGEPDRVLWVYGSEDTKRRIHRRMIEAAGGGPHADKAFPRDRFFAASPGATCLGSPKGLRWLEERMEATKATWVVLDTIQSLTRFDVRDERIVSEWMTSLHDLRDRYQAIISPVAHTSKTPADAKSQRGKADALLGSQAWRALADGLVMIDAQDGDASDARLRLIKGKDIDDPIAPVRLTFNGETKRFRELQEDENAPQRGRVGRAAKVTVDAVLALQTAHPGGFEWSKGDRLLGVSGSSWRTARGAIQKELIDMGHVVIEGMLRWSR